MRVIAVLLAFVAVSACTTTMQAPAQAQTPPADIATCLANVEPDARNTCIGVVSGPCMELPGGETTTGVVQCFARERELWAAQVSEWAARWHASESPTQVEQLSAMLTAHDTWIRAKCAYQASIYEGGSLARVVRAACWRDTTAELALGLMARNDEG